MPRSCAFAVPGDLSASTGGYHYDRRLIEALNAVGLKTRHLALPGSFPFPDEDDLRAAADCLQAQPADCPLIVDGLAFGALETEALSAIEAPIVALIHHPLAHESGLPESDARRLHALERANLTKAAHILVPSGHIRDVLVSEYAVERDRITVIRPGRPDFRPKPSRPSPDGPPLILSVGLLHPRKGHDVLIDALTHCADLDWRAVIVGTPWEPGYDTDLRERIHAAGLHTRIELAGRVSADRLAQLYAEARLFALATRYEGYGIVFDEALIHGLPIVSTLAGAVPGTVPLEAGRLVAPDDPAALAGALRLLLTDQARHKAMSDAALEAGAALPSWQDAARLVEGILTRVAPEQS